MRSVVCGSLAVACALAFLIGTHDARAQGWVVDVSAGQIANRALPGTIGSFGATFGLRFEGMRWLALSAGVPFDSAGAPWAAVGAGARFATTGPVAVGLDLGTQAYGFQDRISQTIGGGGILEVMPLLSTRAGPAGIAVRSGLLYHTSVLAGQSASRSIHASDARVSLGSALFRVTGEGRYLRAEEGDYPYVGAGVEGSAGKGAFWGYAGKWLSDVIEGPVWGAGARFTFGTRTDIFASFQQETNDPLYWNAPQKSWSVGVSRRLGRPAHARPAAVPNSLAPVVSGGNVSFRIPLSASSKAPLLGGDFTGWKAVPMVRSGGFWSVTLPVPRGSHRYAFRHVGGDWFVPPSVPGRTDDGMGGTVAVLIVP